jgi:AcrR family transcriptional regulator
MRTHRPVADRRRQLVDAGLAIAEREGVAAVTARRLAAEAGVSLGLVSYCFATKDELTIALATRIAQELAEAGEAEFEIEDIVEEPDPGDESDQGLTAILQTALAGLWAQVERTPGRQLLTYEITTRALRDPGLGSVAQQQYSAQVAVAAEVLARAGQAAGVTWSRDLSDLAGLVVMAVDGATLRWLVDHDSESALGRLCDIADLLVTMTE